MREVTLRRVAKSWDATGKIRPIWAQIEGRAKREQFAALTGVRATELSAHNTGKPLGMSVAQKIIDGAAKVGITVTLSDLGEPEAKASEEGRRVSDRLAALEVQIESQGKAMTKALNGVTRRLSAIEEALAQQGRPPGPPTRRASQG